MPQTASQSLSLTVSSTLVITTTTLPDAVEFSAYSQQIAASGGTSPYTFSITGGALPTGITLSPSGLLSGTATVSGTFNITVEVVDSGT